MYRQNDEVISIARNFYINYINKVPVELESLCFDFGWNLIKEDLKGEDGYVIKLDKYNKYYIFYDDSGNNFLTRRYRFTIAHEIAHIILGHCELDVKSLSDSELLQLEKDADIAAAEILMPYSELINLGFYNVKELSIKFNVSRCAIETRLSTLGMKNTMQCIDLEISNELAF